MDSGNKIYWAESAKTTGSDDSVNQMTENNILTELVCSERVFRRHMEDIVDATMISQ